MKTESELRERLAYLQRSYPGVQAEALRSPDKGVERAPEVQSALAALGTAIDELDGSTGLLESRLGSVMSPPAEPDGPGKGMRQQSVVPLACHIEEMTERLIAVVDRVGAIMNRLEV
jgi:hypothetical protein